MARHVIGSTGRKAVMADGRTEEIFEAVRETGMFAGATFEVLESELTDDEREGVNDD